MLQGCVPWPNEFSQRYREKGYWKGLTIGDVLAQRAAADPERQALYDGQRRFSYGDVWRLSGRLAVGLLELGLKPLDRVVFQLPNSAEFVIAFFALMRIGVIPIMALPAHRRTEILHFSRASDAKAYFIADRLRDFDYRQMAEEIRAETPWRQVLVQGEALANQTAISDLLGRAIDDTEIERRLASVKPDPGEVALMLLSGGTTALPKLIPRTHDDYVYNFTQAGRMTGFGPDTVYFGLLPFGHNATLASAGILSALAHGGRVVIAPSLDPEVCFRLIQAERATFTLLTPPAAVAFTASPVLSNYDLRSIRNIETGGARTAPELRQAIESKIGCFSQEAYGNAEGLICMVGRDDTGDRKWESAGQPICADDEIKVIDDAEREVPDGTVGELLARGPYTIRGYYNNPDANARAFTADGYYRTGDLVLKRGRHIFHQGRKKELINRGGEKISCVEVEDLIIAHPAVQNVALVPMPDPVYGERACAFVILKPEQTLTLDALGAYLIGRGIAKFKLPEHLEIVDQFPISPAGKVLRRMLKEFIEEKIKAGPAENRS
ncbi:MAG: AMP-binding protein [Rhodospirillales bacterium]|nr:AMP-binding protein [Rhodospirillales bacterium]